jgi:hypothetical protein
VFTEIGGVSISINHRPIMGDRLGETHSAWTLELRGATGASCRVAWCSRCLWREGCVVSEHHYDQRGHLASSRQEGGLFANGRPFREVSGVTGRTFRAFSGLTVRQPTKRDERAARNCLLL